MPIRLTVPIRFGDVRTYEGVVNCRDMPLACLICVPSLCHRFGPFDERFICGGFIHREAIIGVVGVGIETSQSDVPTFVSGMPIRLMRYVNPIDGMTIPIRFGDVRT